MLRNPGLLGDPGDPENGDGLTGLPPETRRVKRGLVGRLPGGAGLSDLGGARSPVTDCLMIGGGVFGGERKLLICRSIIVKVMLGHL